MSLHFQIYIKRCLQLCKIFFVVRDYDVVGFCAAGMASNFFFKMAAETSNDLIIRILLFVDSERNRQKKANGLGAVEVVNYVQI